MSDTPRTDAIALRNEGRAIGLNEAHAQYNDLLDLARQLERELNDLKAPATLFTNWSGIGYTLDGEAWSFDGTKWEELAPAGPRKTAGEGPGGG